MRNEKMANLAKDIIDFDLNPDFLVELSEKFHEIARKHGLKWGTKTEGQAGTTGANPEWTMAKHFFTETVHNKIVWELLMDHPEDLDHYEEEEIE